MVGIEIQQWLDSHINIETLEESRRYTRPTLERMKLLCHYMGDPQDAVKAIHITGTNGKTSTTRMVEKLLQTKGLYTGCIISPHLQIANERIRLDGKMVSDEHLERALYFIKNLEESYSELIQDKVSYFEIFVAAAFELFHQEAIDVGVIEVGMGGLFDATNVCNSDISVITNVQLDHTIYLGNTREKIAVEKSGIIKANNRVVIGEQDDEIAQIFIEKAISLSATPYRLNEDFFLLSNDQALGGRLLTLQTPYALYEDIYLPLYGYHQGVNALCALMAAELFIDGALGNEVVQQGFETVRSPGRMEVLDHNPLIIVDGAHNISGATSLAKTLKDDFGYVQRIWVIGFMKEKDPIAMINALTIEDSDIVIATKADTPRAMNLDQLGKALRELGIEVVVEIESVTQAIKYATSIAMDDSQIIVTGSLYVVGEARQSISG